MTRSRNRTPRGRWRRAKQVCARGRFAVSESLDGASSARRVPVDVSYNMIWNPRAFLDEVDPLLRGARAGPASARRRGERRRMRDSRRMSAWSSSDVARQANCSVGRPLARGRWPRKPCEGRRDERRAEETRIREREGERQREGGRDRGSEGGDGGRQGRVSASTRRLHTVLPPRSRATHVTSSMCSCPWGAVQA